jgi:hypothetical protein
MAIRQTKKRRESPVNIFASWFLLQRQDSPQYKRPEEGIALPPASFLAPPF